MVMLVVPLVAVAAAAPMAAQQHPPRAHLVHIHPGRNLLNLHFDHQTIFMHFSWKFNEKMSYFFMAFSCSDVRGKATFMHPGHFEEFMRNYGFAMGAIMMNHAPATLRLAWSLSCWW